MLVRGGETLSLGGDVTVSVHAIPGHTPGSVAYVVDGQGAVFVGDAVQVHGAANGFPGFVRPGRLPRAAWSTCATRSAPQHLYLGHPYRRADGMPYGVELDAEQAREALDQSLDIEARVAAAAARLPDRGAAGDRLAVLALRPRRRGGRLHGDPTLEPSPFFTSMHGYRTSRAVQTSRTRDRALATGAPRHG